MVTLVTDCRPSLEYNLASSSMNVIGSFHHCSDIRCLRAGVYMSFVMCTFKFVYQLPSGRECGPSTNSIVPYESLLCCVIRLSVKRMHLSIVTVFQVCSTLCRTQPAISCVVMQHVLSVEVGNPSLLLWQCEHAEMHFVAIQRFGGGVLRTMHLND